MSGAVNLKVVLQGVDDIKQKIEKEVVAPAKYAVDTTVRDMKRDVPRIVGKRVAERYNIKSAELQPPQYKVIVSKKTGKTRHVSRSAGVKVTGETLATLSWTWTGVRLTAQRFDMKPGGIPGNKQKYDITFTVLRGRTEKLESDDDRVYFINQLKGVRQGLSRKADRRKIDRVEKTTSIPVMIDNENLQPLINRDINARLDERLNKNIARFAR